MRSRFTIQFNHNMAHSTIKTQSLSIAGVKLWNSLDKEVKQSQSLKAFKKGLKTLFIDIYRQTAQS